MAALSPENIRALEQTRQRLLGLHTSLSALQQELVVAQPLPPWTSFQSHSALINANLQSLARQLSDHQDLLSSLIVHPLPQFPNHQAHIIEQMLRTKLEPEVEDWVEQGQQHGMLTSGRALSGGELNEFWQWAPGTANAEARKQKWGADYTLAEMKAGIDTVATGLRRTLVQPPDETGDEEDEYEEVTDEEEGDEDNEDEGDKMDVVETQAGRPGATPIASSTQKNIPLAGIHKFMVTGIVPQDVK